MWVKSKRKAHFIIAQSPPRPAPCSTAQVQQVSYCEPDEGGAPVLRLSCIESYVQESTVSVNRRDQIKRETKQRECPVVTLAPALVEAAGRIDLEATPRYRGIHRVRLYRAALTFKGRFDVPETPEQKPDSVRRFDQASLALSIADARGIKNAPKLTLNGNGTRARCSVCV